MLKRWLTVGCALGLLVVFLATSASPESTTSGVAYFRQNTTLFAAQGAYPGAMEVRHVTVLLLHQPKTVGTGGLACTHITAAVRECIGTYVLPLGRIQVEGETRSSTVYQLAIVGGLGSYAGAGGVASFSQGLATFFIT